MVMHASGNAVQADEVEAPSKRRWVSWDDEELQQIVENIVQAMLEYPNLTQGKLLEIGQKDLPVDRRRKLVGINSDKRLGAAVKERLSEVAKAEKKLAEPPPEKKPEPKPEPRLTPEQVLAEIPVDRLFMTLFDRMRAAQVAGFARLDERLFRVEAYLAEQQRRELPHAPAATGNESEYMPLILIAGPNRQDFQRIQGSVMSNGVRLVNVDLSDQNNVAVPAHDRLVLWVKCLGKDVLSYLSGRTNKPVVCDGTAAEVATRIVDEARGVRREREITESAQKREK